MMYENVEDRRSHGKVISIVHVLTGLLVFANIINIFFARMGTIPDVLLVAVTIPMFYWVLRQGVEINRIRLFLTASLALLALYFVYAGALLSYRGLRNTAALFSVLIIFIFFYRNAADLVRNRALMILFIVAFCACIFLWHSPVALAKNNINGAMCYFLIAIFLCYTGGRNISTTGVAVLFLLIAALSAINGHRTLAGSAFLLLLQYFVLTANIARTTIRNIMFLALVAVIGTVIYFLVTPELAVIVDQVNSAVTSEGGRRVTSGRQMLWPVVWQEILANPVLGRGPGAVPGDLIVTNLSAHNLYLQVGLQTGFVGIGLVLLVFFGLWKSAKPVGAIETKPVENLATVIITLVIVHSTFDVFLFQNALVIGVPAWIVLGLVLGLLSQQAKEYDVYQRHLQNNNDV